MTRNRRPRMAIWKFSSCDGCQRSLLDCEDSLLELADTVEFASFPDACRGVLRGPYDLSLVEGSVTTTRDVERIHDVRKASNRLVTIGACASSGGIQALRNLADVQNFISLVYAEPAYIRTLDRSTAISEHVKVDFELRGCPVNKTQVLEVVSAVLNRRRPVTSSHPVCVECKLRGNACVMVTRGTPCLGPVTHAGCDALCPSFQRGCYGCYGPSETPNTASLIECWRAMGAEDGDIQRVFHAYHVGSEAFRRAGFSVRRSVAQ